MCDLVARGSQTARAGFRNEDDVVSKFNEWKNDETAQEWLKAMNYVIEDIESVNAEKVTGHFKADVQVRVEIKLTNLQDVQNLQVKLVSNQSGFNQIDKRWVEKYKELWNFDDSIERLLKHFTGEIKPCISNPRDSRRMFMDEFTENEKNIILDFFKDNKIQVVTDILKGRGKFSAEWFLVIRKIDKNTSDWVLKPINYVMNFFGNGEVQVTSKGSLKIGNISLQRKGGDSGRPTANMLQFKIDPTKLFSA